MLFAALILMGVLVNGETSQTLRDASLVRLLKKHYNSAQSPRTLWLYGDYNSQRHQEELHRHTPEGISHNYASYPYGSKSKTVPHQQQTESSFPSPGYLESIQEYWSPSSGYTWNNTKTRTRPYNVFSSSTVGGGSYSIQDEPEGSHSMYQYQQIRPTSIPIKKHPGYYIKNGIKGMETTGKLKYKAPILYYNPSGYKKPVYPRAPYMKLKYPTKKTVHPFYRRYYQSAYQQYPPSDLIRQKVKLHSDHYYKTSDSTTATIYPSTRYSTTERMDESYPETSEDYNNYNETHKGLASYYETYEDVENTTSEPDTSTDDETTTRKYYGDRIYMSTQVPVQAEKVLPKNKYFIIRKTLGSNDFETIFE